MFKPFLIAVSLLAVLLFATAARAANEYVSTTLQEFKDSNKESKGLEIRLLTDSEKQALEAARGPQPRKGDLYILTFEDQFMLLIVRNDVIVFNTEIYPMDLWLKTLKKEKL